MIRSMTGYGRGQLSNGQRKAMVEVRSVNHRFSEVVIRMPKELSPLEERIRNLVQARVSRGRVDVLVSRDDFRGKRRKVEVDRDLAASYFEGLKELQQTLGLRAQARLELIARLPDVFTLAEVPEDLEELWHGLAGAVERALDEMLAMREREGGRLGDDLLERLKVIEASTAAIEARAPQVVEEYRRRLTDRVKEILPGVAVDEGRLTTEIVLFAERSNVTEELVRLRSHLAQMREGLGQSEAVGRRLDFLLQEMNREINTIGSKAADGEIAKVVIDVKSELEKIREQVQNIE
ncbi:MAG: YicC/YloC family endoribonuclease [Bacillota bacterium]